MDVGLTPQCPQAVWFHWGEIEPIFVTLPQEGLAEYDRQRKIPQNNLPRLVIELGPQREQTVSYHGQLKQAELNLFWF